MSFPFAPAVANSAVFSLPPSPIEQEPYRRVPIYKIYPARAYLVGRIHPDLFIVQPLQINIEQEEDETYVISDDLFLVYGSGKDQSEAMRDYVLSLVKFYQLVEKNAFLNPFDNQLLIQLQTHIQSRPLRGYDAIQTDRD
jgi:hypothetical protein